MRKWLYRTLHLDGNASEAVNTTSKTTAPLAASKALSSSCIGTSRLHDDVTGSTETATAEDLAEAEKVLSALETYNGSGSAMAALVQLVETRGHVLFGNAAMRSAVARLSIRAFRQRHFASRWLMLPSRLCHQDQDQDKDEKEEEIQTRDDLLQHLMSEMLQKSPFLCGIADCWIGCSQHPRAAGSWLSSNAIDAWMEAYALLDCRGTVRRGSSFDSSVHDRARLSRRLA